MNKKELIEALNKYPNNIEIYAYDDDGCACPLNCIEESFTYHNPKYYKGKEKKIIILKRKD